MLRAADAMKVAKKPFAKILSALRLRHSGDSIIAGTEKIGRIVTYPTNCYLSSNKRD